MNWGRRRRYPEAPATVRDRSTIQYRPGEACQGESKPDLVIKRLAEVVGYADRLVADTL